MPWSRGLLCKVPERINANAINHSDLYKQSAIFNSTGHRRSIHRSRPLMHRTCVRRGTRNTMVRCLEQHRALTFYRAGWAPRRPGSRQGGGSCCRRRVRVAVGLETVSDGRTAGSDLSRLRIRAAPVQRGGGNAPSTLIKHYLASLDNAALHDPRLHELRYSSILLLTFSHETHA